MKAKENITQLKAIYMLRQGFAISNGYRLLWLFGLFVLYPNLIGLGIGIRRLRMFLAQISPILALVTTIVGLIFFLFRMASSIGLMDSVDNYLKNQKKKFGEIFSYSALHFLRMLVLHIIMLVLVLIAGAFTIFVMYLGRSVFGIGGGCMNVGLTLLLIVMIIGFGLCLGVSFSFAQRFLILDNAGFIESWKKGFKLFYNNYSFAIRLGLTQVGFTVAATILAGIIFLIVSKIPLIGLPATFFLLVVLNGIFGGSFHAMYTYAFLNLTREEVPPVPETSSGKRTLTKNLKVAEKEKA